MSIAPAKSASIADGPALKLFHSTLAREPIALSNQPLFFPTIACGWVMLGNAPTRMTVCAPPMAFRTTNTHARTNRLHRDMDLASRLHREDAGFGGLLFADLAIDSPGTRAVRTTIDQI